MLTERVKELKKKIGEIRDKKLFPQSYARITAERYTERTGLPCTANKVYQVFGPNSSDLVIIEILIELSEEKKEEKLLKRANKVLED